MGLRTTICHRWWFGGCAAAVCCAIVLGYAVRGLAKTTLHKVELTPWERAERGLETLEAIPEGARTRADYVRAMDRFRVVYHQSPGDVHAPDSVNAVAELLAEQGRTLHEAKSLKDAVGQYEFLRTQYPGSSLRVGALLAEAQIYEDDLHDAGAAREKYSLLLKEYPRSAQAEEAKAGIVSLEQGKRNRRTAAVQALGAGRPQEGEKSGDSAAVGQPSSSTQGDRDSSSFAPMQTTSAETSAEKSGASTASGPGEETRSAAPVALHVARSSTKRHGLAQVTGIRHWSTPDYTRVAIDLGDDVTYEAARVPNPDRIYFDLHGTRLAQELVGKSFSVTDDGFLKKIRAAQFSNDMTRVVLDVNDVTEYSAFLLPNPYRLIIDIHGGTKAEPGAAVVD